jgi:hypothetical protein
MSRRALTISLLLGAVIAVDASRCVAQDHGEGELPPPTGHARHARWRKQSAARPTLEWYGWQTFAVDGVAASLFLGAVADHGNTTLYGLSGVTYTLSAPIVHLSHAQWEMSLASLGIRAVTPLLGAAIGSHYDDCQTASVTGGPRRACSSKWETTGIALGGLVAVAFDGLVLAYQPARRVEASAGQEETAALRGWPSATPLPGGILIGWAGSI